MAPVNAVEDQLELTGSDDGRGSGSEERSGRSRQRVTSETGSITSGASSTISLVTWRDAITSNDVVAIDLVQDDYDNKHCDDEDANKSRQRNNNRRRRTASVGMRDLQRPLMRTKKDGGGVVICASAVIPLLDWHMIHDSTLVVR